MVVFLGWYETLIKVSIEIEILFRKSFNIAVFVSYACRSAKGPSSMSITGLELLDYAAAMSGDNMTYIDNPPNSFPQGLHSRAH